MNDASLKIAFLLFLLVHALAGPADADPSKTLPGWKNVPFGAKPEEVLGILHKQPPSKDEQNLLAYEKMSWGGFTNVTYQFHFRDGKLVNVRFLVPIPDDPNNQYNSRPVMEAFMTFKKALTDTYGPPSSVSKEVGGKGERQPLVMDIADEQFYFNIWRHSLGILCTWTFEGDGNQILLSKLNSRTIQVDYVSPTLHEKGEVETKKRDL